MKSFLTCLFILAITMPAVADPIVPTTLSVVPIGGDLKVGSDVTVGVIARDPYLGDTLVGWQTDVDFSTNLAFVSQQEGSFFTNLGSTYFLPGSVDQSSGVISAVADALIGNPSGPPNGDLLDLTFQVTSPGPGFVLLANTILSDNTYTSYAVISEPFSFTVYPSFGSGTAPEPTTFGLAGLAGGLMIIALLLSHHKREERPSRDRKFH